MYTATFLLDEPIFPLDEAPRMRYNIEKERWHKTMEQQHKQSRFWAETAVLLLLLCEWALSLASVSIDGVLGNLLGLLSYPVPICLFLLLFSRRQEIHLPLRPTTAGLMRVLPLLPVFLAAVLSV